MTRRGLLGLSAAAAAVAGVAVLLAPARVERALPAAEGGLAFPGLAARLAGATRIEIGRPDGVLVLARRGETWTLPDRGDHPVRAERVRELLVGLTELRLAERRTADPAQLERLGVGDPAQPGSTAVPLRVLDGQGGVLVDLVVGRRRVRAQGNVPESVYVRRAGETQAWLGEGRLSADADPQLWIDRDIANLPSARLRRVEVRRTDQPLVVLERAEGDALRVAEPPGITALDEVGRDEVGRAFEYLTFLEVRSDAPMPGTALGEARFDLGPELRIQVWPHREADTLWVRLRAEGGEEAARLNARWTGWAYQVGVWKEKAFLPRLEELVERPRTAPPSPAGPPTR